MRRCWSGGMPAKGTHAQSVVLLALVLLGWTVAVESSGESQVSSLKGSVFSEGHIKPSFGSARGGAMSDSNLCPSMTTKALGRGGGRETSARPKTVKSFSRLAHYRRALARVLRSAAGRGSAGARSGSVRGGGGCWLWCGVRTRTLLVLDLGLHVVNGVTGLHLESDGLPCTPPAERAT